MKCGNTASLPGKLFTRLSRTRSYIIIQTSFFMLLLLLVWCVKFSLSSSSLFGDCIYPAGYCSIDNEKDGGCIFYENALWLEIASN